MKKVLVLLSAFVFLWGCEKVGADEPVKDDTTIEDETPDTEAPDSLLTDYVLPERRFSGRQEMLFHSFLEMFIIQDIHIPEKMA